jgi:putative FmdB family regulatory protein
MPLYEHYCADCQTKFEALRPMSQADTAIPCKACDSAKTSRVLSLFAAYTGSDSNGGRPAMSASHGGFGGCGCGGVGCGCGH